jgi:RNA polymerase sigma factor (sigma-70 family)
MSTFEWRQILKGDKDAFLAFYKNNYQRLYSYGFRICGDKEMVKDSIQELFLELWKTRKTVNIHVSKDGSYLMTWLRRIISRQQLKDSSRTRFETPDAGSQPSYEQLLINQQTDEQTREQLRDALRKLTPKQLSIIQARFFDEKSYDDIAIENKMAKQSVYNTIHKVIDILRENIIKRQ